MKIEIDTRYPIPRSGTLYGIDTKYFRPGSWLPMREGSNFEVPSFRLVDLTVQIPFATGKSKKLYEKAVCRALAEVAITDSPGIHHPGVRQSDRTMMEAFDRLLERRDA